MKISSLLFQCFPTYLNFRTNFWELLNGSRSSASIKLLNGSLIAVSCELSDDLIEIHEPWGPPHPSDTSQATLEEIQGNRDSISLIPCSEYVKSLRAQILTKRIPVAPPSTRLLLSHQPATCKTESWL